MNTNPIHRFAELRGHQPDLSDSMLLNSNNQTKFTGDADVVVAGAGILGLCYAIHLKNISPRLKIEVFEKSPAPMQKIGESTLSPFSKFTTGDVLPHDFFLRLFGLKDGLQFYCVDQQGISVTSSDVGGLDLSFQLDRRVSELLLIMWAQRMGINVYHGVDIDFKIAGDNTSDVSNTDREEPVACPGLRNRMPVDTFKPPEVVLRDSSQSIGNHIKAKLVCDATGFSRKLTSKFGKKEQLGAWNCDAYWAYFKERDGGNAESVLDHLDYPATKHVCFPEGWGWFISLISWHKSPLGNLMDLIAYIIDSAKSGLSADEIPCTKDLSATFGCPYEFITSIGFAVRNDYKLPENLEMYGSTESERKFAYFQQRYPVLNRLMNGKYELLPKYYGEQTYFVRKSMASRSPVVAGEGWFAIGNSAGFTNPLISPGINAGIGGAFLAATLTAKTLAAPAKDARIEMQTNAKAFQTYSHDFMMPQLHQMNTLWYNMFRDRRLFENLSLCFWALGLEHIDTHYASRKIQFTPKHTQWVLGAGSDVFKDFCNDVLSILEPSSAGGVRPSESEVEKVCERSQQCIALCREMYPDNQYGRYLREYDDSLVKVVGKRERDVGGKHFAVRCGRCRHWVHSHATMCPVCGQGKSVLTSTGEERHSLSEGKIPLVLAGNKDPVGMRRVAVPMLVVLLGAFLSWLTRILPPVLVA